MADDNFIFISVAAYEDLPAATQKALAARWADPTMSAFLDAQEKAAREQLGSIDPDERHESDDTFRRRFREARLIWRFWSDLKDFTQLWAKRAQT